MLEDGLGYRARTFAEGEADVYAQHLTIPTGLCSN